jgi:hypothetical protein
VFLTPTGGLLSKLNSFKDFPGMHPDVSTPPRTRNTALEDEQSHTNVFLNHLAVHFGRK